MLTIPPDSSGTQIKRQPRRPDGLKFAGSAAAGHVFRRLNERGLLGSSAASVSPATITVEEFAEQAGVSRSTAYEACRTGQVPHIRLGRRILIPADAVNRMFERVTKEVSP